MLYIDAVGSKMIVNEMLQPDLQTSIVEKCMRF